MMKASPNNVGQSHADHDNGDCAHGDHGHEQGARFRMAMANRT